MPRQQVGLKQPFVDCREKSRQSYHHLELLPGRQRWRLGMRSSFYSPFAGVPLAKKVNLAIHSIAIMVVGMEQRKGITCLFASLGRGGMESRELKSENQ